ncbi:TadE/TadG family type IV pilus assembly protein [Streptomyces sp. NPDC057638]|uniref:TadE/TadG family type IV pilus assembly protein n=1 Tax=Streptomyces sp. NPDC057638 TaxID=3346190 RepID=UPI00368E6669
MAIQRHPAHPIHPDGHARGAAAATRGAAVGTRATAVRMRGAAVRTLSTVVRMRSAAVRMRSTAVRMRCAVPRGGDAVPRIATAVRGGGARTRPRRLRTALPWRDDRGQAAIEFTGTVPVILATLALLWQTALVGYTFVLAGNAADEGARAGAVGGPAACQEAAVDKLPGAWRDGGVSCSEEGDLVRAEVNLSVPVLFPGTLQLDLSIPGEAAAPREYREGAAP